MEMPGQPRHIPIAARVPLRDDLPPELPRVVSSAVPLRHEVSLVRRERARLAGEVTPLGRAVMCQVLLNGVAVDAQFPCDRRPIHPHGRQVVDVGKACVHLPACLRFCSLAIQAQARQCLLRGTGCRDLCEALRMALEDPQGHIVQVAE